MPLRLSGRSPGEIILYRQAPAGKNARGLFLEHLFYIHPPLLGIFFG